MTNANVGGWIPLRNGFIAGYGITVHNTLTASTGMAFRVYRNGIASECVFHITDDHNDDNGATRAREFNTIPAGYYTVDDRNVFQFKAGERIALRAETPTLPNLSETTDITKVNIFLYYVYDITEDETINARREAGGNIDNTPGGGEDGGGAVGDGGMVVS